MTLILLFVTGNAYVHMHTHTDMDTSVKSLWNTNMKSLYKLCSLYPMHTNCNKGDSG